MAAFAAAEAKLTKALSSVRTMRMAICTLGNVDMYTGRAAMASLNASTRWCWIEISPTPHSIIGRGKIFVGRAEETEAHIAEALRLSPRDTLGSTSG